MKRILIIEGHPDPSQATFGHALAEAYAAGAQSAGHEVARLTIAALEFPLIRSQHEFEKEAPPAVIAATQDSIKWANHMVVLYPLWMGEMPALFKAFLEQTFRNDFAMKPTSGMPVSLLKGRSLRIIVTMGMPAIAFRILFGGFSVRAFARVSAFIGFGPIRKTLIGGVDAIGKSGRERWLARMKTLGARGT